MYDVIGDIHGELDPLERLLEKLGYRHSDGAWRHPGRQALFLGDLIDRGERSREVVGTVRAMVEAGQARCIMGNHELNAIGYHTPDPESPGEFLRPHSKKNRDQHWATLDSYKRYPETLADDLAWFRTLPFWLELDGLRAVHAAWLPEAMALIEGSGVRERDDWPEALPEAFDEFSPLGAAISEVLKGVEWRLPNGGSFHDKEGNERHEARVTWWDVSPGDHWPAIALGPPEMVNALPDTPIPPDYPALKYPGNGPPVFFGHYWLRGEPAPLAENIACLDYSVAKGGHLVAYRWDGERQLRRENFVAVAAR